MNLLKSSYSEKKVLITGHTGFKGSWLSIWLNMLGAEVYGYALEPKTERDNFVKCGLNNKLNHYIGDIRNYDKLSEYIDRAQPEIIFHLAAQPLVLESYNNPHETFETNILGTANVLDIARNTTSVKAVVIITTDKVYENNGWTWGYRENDRLGGKDPYSASKTATEIIADSYRHSYFNQEGRCILATARAGNVIGGGDWAENRILPDFFRSIIKNEKLILRNPWHTRPWEHVLEPLGGYLLLGAKILNSSRTFGGAWNFGPSLDNDYAVKELIDKIIVSFGRGEIEYDKSIEKPFESSSLRLDISKAVNQLKWKPVLDIDSTVEFTVDGYNDDLSGEILYEKRKKQIEKYIRIAMQKNITWLFE